MTHTPTPWHIRNIDTDSPVIAYSDGEIWSSVLNNACLAEEHGGTALDNARFIVKACNAHDELVTALGSIKEWCFPAPVEMPDDSDARCEWYARRLLTIANSAHAALTKAQK